MGRNNWTHALRIVVALDEQELALELFAVVAEALLVILLLCELLKLTYTHQFGRGLLLAGRSRLWSREVGRKSLARVLFIFKGKAPPYVVPAVAVGLRPQLGVYQLSAVFVRCYLQNVLAFVYAPKGVSVNPGGL